MSQENVEVVRKLYELQWTPEALELLDPQLIDAGGDQVVVVSRVIGTGSSSGVPLDQEFGSLFTLLNRKIVRCQGFESRAEALQAAGWRV